MLVRPWRAEVQRRCDVTLAPGRATPVGSLDRCEEVALVDDAAKGRRPWYRPRLAVEVALAGLRPVDDDFDETLTGFGYRRATGDPLKGLRLSGRVVARYGPTLSAVASLATLGGGEYRRDGEVRELVYDWQTYAASIGVRAGLPLLGGRATPYLELGGGPAAATTSFSGPTGDRDDQLEWGWHLGATGGLAVAVSRRFSLFAEASWVTAPIIDNLIGDTHDSGGVIFWLGGRANLHPGEGR